MYSLFATGCDESWISGIWDHQEERHFIPGFQKKMLLKKETIFEKNWIPLVVNNELYVIRHLDPLQIMKCRMYENCKFVKNNTDALNFEMDDLNNPLRGGTTFELYKYPYYIGIGHTTYFNGPKKRFYKPHLMVLCVNPFQIVYVSDPLQIHPDLYKPYLGPQLWKVIQGNFIFPLGLMAETDDSLVIGVHINDRASMLLRLEGIKPILDSVIEKDRDNKSLQSDGFIQKYMMQRGKYLNITGVS